ncbi:DUF6465 family protein [Clostridium pasteurianum]|uniref:Uncharacterized protein n=1 Tax=Clostridium pasteurianum BC1 TaxID=86416 RepID=R4K350_CLOPA|nr:DUF6465 family protein [Clostridium pasteurianum]AGK97527.1 hypothetical protein Clopa_2674 [Clostridium pasteurianum BC1]
MSKRIKNLNELKDATIDASKVTAKKVIDASETAKVNIQKNLNELKDVSKSTAQKVRVASKTAQKTIAKTSEDIAKAVNIKGIKENIEPPLNKSKENIQKNLSDLKDVTLDVSKATAKKVLNASEELVNSVKSNINKPKAFTKSIYIQYLGKEISEDYLVEQFRLKWSETHKLSDIVDLKIYYKVEENTAYYLVNNEITLSIKFI